MAGKRGVGKGLRFIQRTASEHTNQCVEWPYYRMRNGYGQLGDHTGMHLAHRYMCRLAHGEPTEEKPYAAHSCGNRACVNPLHLRWVNQSENEYDKHVHGTWYDRISNAKLTPDRVRLIRTSFAMGLDLDSIALAFQTPLSTIRKVVNRETWKHVD